MERKWSASFTTWASHRPPSTFWRYQQHMSPVVTATLRERRGQVKRLWNVKAGLILANTRLIMLKAGKVTHYFILGNQKLKLHSFQALWRNTSVCCWIDDFFWAHFEPMLEPMLHLNLSLQQSEVQHSTQNAPRKLQFRVWFWSHPHPPIMSGFSHHAPGTSSEPVQGYFWNVHVCLRQVRATARTHTQQMLAIFEIIGFQTVTKKSNRVNNCKSGIRAGSIDPALREIISQ